MKIQQMVFMILAVFFFFMLVGLIFLSYQSKSLLTNYQNLQKEQTISSLQTLINMPELSCGSLCIDEDKLKIIQKEDYSEIWPVSSIEVYRIYPANQSSGYPDYYNVYDSGKSDIQKYSTYVSLCRKLNEMNYVYDRCDIAKLVVGVK